MSKKQVSITEQILALEEENKHLKEQEKIIAKIRSLVTENESSNVSTESIFEKKIANFFGLKSESDKADFLRIMLSSSSLNYFNKSRLNDTETTAE